MGYTLQRELSLQLITIKQVNSKPLSYAYLNANNFVNHIKLIFYYFINEALMGWTIAQTSGFTLGFVNFSSPLEMSLFKRFSPKLFA